MLISIKNMWFLNPFFFASTLNDIIQLSFPSLTATVTEYSPFPYDLFFNYTKNNEDHVSKYLCSVNSSSDKCCSCSDDCRGNCCIDVMWNSMPLIKLDEYLELFQIYVPKKKCLSVIPDKNKNHIIEHLKMVSSYSDHNIDCPDEEFPKPVVNRNNIVYVTKRCAILNGETDVVHLNLTVRCVDATNVFEGDIFSLNHLTNMSQCVVSVPESDIYHLWESGCPNEIDDCNTDDMNHDLCKSYYAPIDGFKNQHCYLCNKMIFGANLQLDNCDRENTNGINDIKVINNHNHKRKFKLVLNEEMKYVIRDLNTIFPIMKFLGISKVTPNFGKVISSRLCSEESATSKCCSCDKFCFKFQSCCMDILWNGTHPITIDRYKDLLIRHSKKYKQHSCETFGEGNAFYTVSSCLANSSVDDKQKCLNHESTTFFQGADNYLYKNEHCAKCNHIADYQKFEFDSNKNYFKTPIERFCGTEKRICDLENPHYDLCHSYESNLDRWPNIFCFLCSTNRSVAIPIDIACGHSSLPWSLTVSFSFMSESVPLKCENGQVLDETQQKCVTIRCQKHLEVKGSKCVPRSSSKLITRTRNATVDRCMSKSGPYLYLKLENETTLSKFFSILNTTLHLSNDTISINNASKVSFVHKTAHNLSAEFFYDIVAKYSKLKNIFEESEGYLSIGLSTNVIIDNFHNIDYLNNFPEHRICHKPRFIDLRNGNFTENCSFSYNGNFYSWTNISTWIRLNKFNISRFVSVCDQFYLISNCSLTLMPNSDIILHKNSSITYMSKGGINKIFEISEYIPVETGVAVCDTNVKSMPSTDKWLLSAQRVDVYISLIGSAISIPSYILVILTYCMQENIKTTPGKCLLMLTGALFFADLLHFLLGIVDECNILVNGSLCEAISILVHFLLLLSHGWCVVIALDLALTFVPSTSLRNNRNIKVFYSYFAMILMLSVATVTISILLDQFKIVTFDYSRNNKCIPHGSYGFLYFYLVPILSAFATSLILLFATMVKLSHDTKRNQNILQTNRNINVPLMALKLTFVLGLSEGIGFIQKPNSNDDEKRIFQVIGIMYSFLRGLRGLLLALVYVCRKDVLDLWKKRIVKNDNACQRISVPKTATSGM